MYALALLPPVDELDAELECALRMPQEIVFVELHQAVELRDRGDRRLADADDADLGGFDQRDGQPRAQDARQRGGRHPAGGAATGDDDRSDFLTGHAASISGTRLKERHPPAIADGCPACGGTVTGTCTSRRASSSHRISGT